MWPSLADLDDAWRKFGRIGRMLAKFGRNRAKLAELGPNAGFRATTPRVGTCVRRGRFPEGVNSSSFFLEADRGRAERPELRQKGFSRRFLAKSLARTLLRQPILRAPGGSGTGLHGRFRARARCTDFRPNPSLGRRCCSETLGDPLAVATLLGACGWSVGPKRVPHVRPHSAPGRGGQLYCAPARGGSEKRALNRKGRVDQNSAGIGVPEIGSGTNRCNRRLLTPRS